MNTALRLIAVLLPLAPAQFAGQPPRPAPALMRFGFASATSSSVVVPDGAASLFISVKTSVSVKIFVRYGQPVDAASGGFDYSLDAAPGQSSLQITPQSTPPLKAGTYYIAYSDPGQGSVSVSMSVTAGGAAPGAPVSAQTPAGAAPAPPVIAQAGVVNAASFAPEVAPGAFVTIYGQNLAAGQMSWQIPDGHTLPTTLGDVSVRINGKDCFVNYVSPTQVNVLAPPDAALGTVTVEVATPRGTATAQATMVPVSPGFFTYALNGKPHAIALFANTATLVAPAGALPGVDSRTARPGDLLQLYATGLGPTAPAYPAGQVLTKAYPVEDLSRVTATIGGVPAEVLFAGMTYAGLFQVNLRVPQNIPAGDLPVVLTVDGRLSQSDAVLTFAP